MAHEPEDRGGLDRVGRVVRGTVASQASAVRRGPRPILQEAAAGSDWFWSIIHTARLESDPAESPGRMPCPESVRRTAAAAGRGGNTSASAHAITAESSTESTIRMATPDKKPLAPDAVECRHLPIDDVLSLSVRIKRVANGMLSARVYGRLFELARRGRPRSIVEIGTAHGAATIAMALGARAGGLPFHVHTVDPFAGFSSRAKFGSVTDNMRIVRDAFSHFDVAECITVVVGTSADLIPHLPGGEIDLLLIDADGRLDRDLALFFDRLATDANIVIDDVDGATCLTRFQNRTYCDQKHRLSRLIVDRLIASGHLRGEHVEESTGFYSRGTGAASTIEALALPAYRELVFADIDDIAVPRGRAVFHPWLRRFSRPWQRSRDA